MYSIFEKNLLFYPENFSKRIPPSNAQNAIPPIFTKPVSYYGPYCI